MTKPPTDHGERPQAPGGPGASRRILVADDDSLNRRLIERRLRHAGFDVWTVSTGEAALLVASSAPPDAILSDVHMPGMNGFELRRSVRADARLADVPVILLSSGYDPSLRTAEDDDDGSPVPRSPDLREAIEALVEAIAERSRKTQGPS